MSRIGNKPITVPAGVEVKVEGQHITVKGPKGTLERDINPEITVKFEDGTLTFTRRSDIFKFNLNSELLKFLFISPNPVQ